MKPFEVEETFKPNAIVVNATTIALIPEDLIYFTFVNITSYNYKIVIKTLVCHYDYIFFLFEKDIDKDIIKFIQQENEMAMFFPVLIKDDYRNTSLEFIKNFNSIMIITKTQIDDNKSVITDAINTLWKSMYYDYWAVIDEYETEFLSDHRDILYLTNAEGVTLYNSIQNNMKDFELSLKLHVNSFIYKKKVQRAFLNFKVHPSFSSEKLSEYATIFYELFDDIDYAFSVICDNTLEKDDIKLDYFINGLALNSIVKLE